MSREFSREDRTKDDESMIVKRALRKTDDAELEQIDMEGFNYADKEKDREYVVSVRARIEEENVRHPEQRELEAIAKIFEAIVTEQAELNAWLDDNVNTRKTADYDDLKNGVDVVLEIERADATSHMALAVDITYGDFLVKKMDRIKKEIRDGLLTSVKYFESTDGTFKGTLSRIPRVVVGIEKFKVIELAQQWLQRSNREMARHVAQLQIIEEIVVQLECYRDYAASVGRSELVKIFERYVNIFTEVVKQKEELFDTVDPQGNFREDRVYKRIMELLKFFK